MCQKARILDADSSSWTPILTFYKLLEIERTVFTQQLNRSGISWTVSGG
jgi:hypothetical protein